MLEPGAPPTEPGLVALNVAPVDRIRAHFPALARREGGWPVGYFDGPGGTQVPEVVARAVADYLLDSNANTHWAYATSVETDDLIEHARSVFADLFACTAAEVVFGANMTTLTFHVARALGRGWGEGDEIVVTRLDHQANVAPWQALAIERGVRVREVPFDTATGTLDLDAFEAALGERTRMVAVGGASNALGTVNDLATLIAGARRVGALAFVDAVHLVPHEIPDVRRLGCDLLACSPYKFYGPHLGALYVRRELLADMDVPRLACAPSEPPERAETGTLSHEGIAGAAAAVEFLASLAEPRTAGTPSRARLEAVYEELHRRGEALVERLWEGLASVRGVRLYGPVPGRHPRTPTVAFTLEGHDPSDVAWRLGRELGVFVSHGDFYASAVVEDLGLADRGGLVRAGAACYTTSEEVDRLVRGVAELAHG